MHKTCVLRSKNFKQIGIPDLSTRQIVQLISPAIKNCITLPKALMRVHYRGCRNLVLPKFYVDIWNTI